ncbi:hypothetical protein BEN74_15035 [Acinetobacter sp. WCHAc010034]|nr:hypothetical protein BEN74_15035 [Acinetobacter sp. WCHAc010034]
MQFILQSFPRTSEVGDRFDARKVSFLNEGLSYGKVILQDAISELVKEGFLTPDNRLTEKGLSDLFLPSIERIKVDFYDYLDSCNLSKGDYIDAKRLGFDFLISLSSSDNELFMSKVLPDLISEGFIERKNGMLYVA